MLGCLEQLSGSFKPLRYCKYEGTEPEELDERGVLVEVEPGGRTRLPESLPRPLELGGGSGGGGEDNPAVRLNPPDEPEYEGGNGGGGTMLALAALPMSVVPTGELETW